MDISPASIGLYTGLGLCAAAGARCAGVALRWIGDRRRERRVFLESLRNFEDELDRRQIPGPPAHACPAWKGYRRFTVQRIVQEADDVRSIYLAPEDRRTLPAFIPGQFLTLRVNVPGLNAPAVRCYSLSERPRNDYYRISVKAVPAEFEATRSKGKVSRYLNKGLHVGDVLEAQSPRGDFHLDFADPRPVVLIAAGIGITPLLSMANTLLHQAGDRRVILFYGVRNRREHAFHDYLRDRAADDSRLQYFPYYSQPGEQNHETPEGRIDVELIRRSLPGSNFPFYVCGPGSFMESIVDGLRAWGVDDRDVHFEAFGPSTIKQPAGGATTHAASVIQSRIVFQRSGIAAQWNDAASSLLELGESQDVPLPSGCRSGNCGMCATRLISGQVRYSQPPTAPLDPGFCLTCVAAPDAAEIVLDA